MVAIRMRQPDPPDGARIDHRRQGSEERLTLDRPPGVDEHRLVGVDDERVDGECPKARDLDEVSDDVYVADSLCAHFPAPHELPTTQSTLPMPCGQPCRRR